MGKHKNIPLDFVIDKITENVLTGDSFNTEITLVTKADLKLIPKNNGWIFDWKYEFKKPVTRFIN